MKRVILCTVFAIASWSFIHAQDIIIQTNGEEIKAKVVEIGTTDVKYKKYGNESGPNYSLAKSKIFMIRYENGDKDVFTELGAKAETPTTTAVPRTAISQPAVVQKQETQTYSQPVATANYPQLGHKKGYLGFLIGGGTVLEDYSNVDGGVHYSINAGYLFSDNIGIQISLFGSSYSLSNNSDASIGLRGTLVGPLFSFPMSDYKFYFDLRPSIGLVQGDIASGTQTGTTDGVFGAGMGASFRWILSNSFALSFNTDYITGKIDELDWPNFGFTVGFNWVF
ncbi:MAG: porin family protein [Dysgonamonadaceae bacterium]|jgi:hypothetical protein|nr:porin family protein [Dysgonamonadaceae bacterium]